MNYANEPSAGTPRRPIGEEMLPTSYQHRIIMSAHIADEIEEMIGIFNKMKCREELITSTMTKASHYAAERLDFRRSCNTPRDRPIYCLREFITRFPVGQRCNHADLPSLFPLHASKRPSHLLSLAWPMLFDSKDHSLQFGR